MAFPFFAVFLLLGTAPGSTPETQSLEFRDFFVASPRELKPSPRLLGLAGQRVRLVGYMALMEEPPKGAFYLCAFPVEATESGGGTADLPPEAVLVVVPSARGRELAHIPRRLEAVGVLEVGPGADDDGRVSAIRLILDGPVAAATAASRSAQP